MSAKISVEIAAQDDGGVAHVRIEDGGHTTEHEITVRRDYVDKIAGSKAAVEDLVRASLEFLLDREPPSAILRRFDLAVINRYFPDYEPTMKDRFGA